MGAASPSLPFKGRAGVGMVLPTYHPFDKDSDLRMTHHPHPTRPANAGALALRWACGNAAQAPILAPLKGRATK